MNVILKIQKNVKISNQKHKKRSIIIQSNTIITRNIRIRINLKVNKSIALNANVNKNITLKNKVESKYNVKLYKT